MFARVVKGEKNSRVVDIVREVARGSYNVEGFEVNTCMMRDRPLNEKGASIEIDNKCIILYSVDGGSYNEYDSIQKVYSASNVPVVYGGSEIYTSYDSVCRIIEDVNSTN